MDRLSIFLKNKTMDFKFDKFHFPKIYLGTIRSDISLVPEVQNKRGLNRVKNFIKVSLGDISKQR